MIATSADNVRFHRITGMGASVHHFDVDHLPDAPLLPLLGDTIEIETTLEEEIMHRIMNLAIGHRPMKIGKRNFWTQYSRNADSNAVDAVHQEGLRQLRNDAKKVVMITSKPTIPPDSDSEGCRHHLARP